MLVSIEEVMPGVRLGLRSFALLEGQKARDGERIAVRKLVEEMLGTADFAIGHDEAGKPVLADCNISVSHTKGYVAVLMSETYSVGVDIEYMSDRVDRIASRFMRVDERADCTEERLVNWCSKEAAYKLFSEDNLTYQQMRVSIGANGNGAVENLKRSISVPVRYRVSSGYVLVYCVC